MRFRSILLVLWNMKHDNSIEITIWLENNDNGTFIFLIYKRPGRNKKFNGQRREKKQWCKKKEYMQSKE